MKKTPDPDTSLLELSKAPISGRGDAHDFPQDPRIERLVPLGFPFFGGGREAPATWASLLFLEYAQHSPLQLLLPRPQVSHTHGLAPPAGLRSTVTLSARSPLTGHTQGPFPNIIQPLTRLSFPFHVAPSSTVHLCVVFRLWLWPPLARKLCEVMDLGIAVSSASQMPPGTWRHSKKVYGRTAALEESGPDAKVPGA